MSSNAICIPNSVNLGEGIILHKHRNSDSDRSQKVLLYISPDNESFRLQNLQSWAKRRIRWGLKQQSIITYRMIDILGFLFGKRSQAFSEYSSNSTSDSQKPEWCYFSIVMRTKETLNFSVCKEDEDNIILVILGLQELSTNPYFKWHRSILLSQRAWMKIAHCAGAQHLTKVQWLKQGIKNASNLHNSENERIKRSIFHNPAWIKNQQKQMSNDMISNNNSINQSIDDRNSNDLVVDKSVMEQFLINCFSLLIEDRNKNQIENENTNIQSEEENEQTTIRNLIFEQCQILAQAFLDRNECKMKFNFKQIIGEDEVECEEKLNRKQNSNENTFDQLLFRFVNQASFADDEEVNEFCAEHKREMNESLSILTKKQQLEEKQKKEREKQKAVDNRELIREMTLCYSQNLPSKKIETSIDTLENFVVAGYLPEWRLEQIDYNSISPLLTHLLLFSIEVDNNGDLCELNRLPSPLKLKEIREITHKHNTKLIISFGGFGRSNGFPIISIDEHLRKLFVTNALQFINEYEMEGIDLNWEYPSTEQEWRGLFEIITLFKRESEDLILSMAFYPGQEKILGTHSPLSMQYLVHNKIDFFHMMAYDNMQNRKRSKHSTFSFAENCIQNAINFGIPANKLTLGLPFYARHMLTGDWKTYEEIISENESKLKSDVLVSMNEWNGYYFNGYAMIVKKVEMAMKQEIAGVMIWEIGQDLSVDHPLSLLKAIESEIRSETKYDRIENIAQSRFTHTEI